MKKGLGQKTKKQQQQQPNLFEPPLIQSQWTSINGVSPTRSERPGSTPLAKNSCRQPWGRERSKHPGAIRLDG